MGGEGGQIHHHHDHHHHNHHHHTARDIWKLRELIPVAIEEEGRVHKYDVSIPLAHFYDIVADTRARCGRA